MGLQTRLGKRTGNAFQASFQLPSESACLPIMEYEEEPFLAG